jgi:hypothetical protein
MCFRSFDVIHVSNDYKMYYRDLSRLVCATTRRFGTECGLGFFNLKALILRGP